MNSTSRPSARDEARRILRQVFAKTRKWPSPTGMSVYVPKATDVIVSTFPKSGTTLLQNMIYQITVATGGAPTFDPDGTKFSDICEVAPWLDYGPEFGVLECGTVPRIFKTHSRVSTFDVSQATYIYCIRDPESYPASWLNFLLDELSNEDIVDQHVREEIFHLFVKMRLLGLHEEGVQQSKGSYCEEVGNGLAGPWFQHVKGWIDTPRSNVLVLFYEDVVADLRGTALCVARFMNRTLPARALETVVQRCSRDSMAGDPRFNCVIEARSFGLSENGAEKVKAENVGGFKQYRIRQEDRMRLCEMMRTTFGVSSYKEFAASVRRRQSELFPALAYNSVK